MIGTLWCLYVSHYFTPFSSIAIVEFEQVNAG